MYEAKTSNQFVFRILLLLLLVGNAISLTHYISGISKTRDENSVESTSTSESSDSSSSSSYESSSSHDSSENDGGYQPGRPVHVFRCPTRDGQYPHAVRCDAYWRCYCGVAYYQRCPPRTSYDRREGRCSRTISCKRGTGGRPTSGVNGGTKGSGNYIKDDYHPIVVVIPPGGKKENYGEYDPMTTTSTTIGPTTHHPSSSSTIHHPNSTHHSTTPHHSTTHHHTTTTTTTITTEIPPAPPGPVRLIADKFQY